MDHIDPLNQPYALPFRFYRLDLGDGYDAWRVHLN
jgi:hypothetical protein